MRRVVLTGAGCITPLGHNVAEFARSVEAVQTGIRPMEDVKPGDLHFAQTASVQSFHAAEWLTVAQSQIAERSSSFAIAAARQALAQAQLAKAYAGDEIALVFGCSAGGRSA